MVLDGAVVESFAPDFYLPDLDLYLELTTLRQKLVRKKNRKLRRLRELYPDVHIKLFYARDFRALMLKYGKLALVDDLSGTIGPGRDGSRGRPGRAGRRRWYRSPPVGPRRRHARRRTSRPDRTPRPGRAARPRPAPAREVVVR